MLAAPGLLCSRAPYSELIASFYFYLLLLVEKGSFKVADYGVVEAVGWLYLGKRKKEDHFGPPGKKLPQRIFCSKRR